MVVAQARKEVGEESVRHVGPYRLEERLGAGGMGQVFRAVDERLQRPVAIKRVREGSAGSPRARSRFLREARSAARLHHPNIVKVHDILSEGEDDWIVMELVEGETLARVLERGALPPEQVVSVGVRVAEALEAAHAQNIVHRDLKSQNIVLDTSGRPKILDFGLAKWTEDSSATTLTVEGLIVGTPHAMSPEQAMGRKVDLRSDLFSLGSLLYELALGEAPFRGRNAIESIQRVCVDQPPALSERLPAVPRDLSDLVARLLEKEPGHRPRSATEVVEALRRIGRRSMAVGVDPAVPEPDRASPSGGSESQVESTLGGSTLVEAAPGISERRQVTVVCCGLSTQLGPSNDLDPSKYYRALVLLEKRVTDIVEDLGGYRLDTLGHQVVACFGYPMAHEDDVRRALQCSVKVVEEVSRLRVEAPATEALEIRIGLHTGQAVVLKTDRSERLVLGTTVESAEGLCRRAEPDQIVLSDAARRLIGDTAEVMDLGVDRPEIPQGSNAYRVVSARQSSGSWGDAELTSPLVARDRELDILRSRLRRVTSGQGQLVLVGGEAGIGKSRLVQELRRESQREGTRWLTAQCSQRFSNTPLVPVGELLRQRLEIRAGQPMEAQIQKLEQAFERVGRADTENMSLLGPILDLPLPASEERELSPERRRELTFELVLDLLARDPGGEPIGALVEDLHWSDPSSLELLGLLVGRLSSSKLFLLMTHRPEFAVPQELADSTRIDLNRLSTQAVESLVERVSGGKPLPDEVRQQILSKTDGVPLFVEELTRYLLDSKDLVELPDRWELVGSVDDLDIPSTLRGSLTARLDRLGSAKPIAQLASVLGREFSHQLLDAISDLGFEVLDRELESLIRARLVRRRGFGPRARYLFRHALIQDAAYDSLLKGQRQGFHRRIAQTLESSFPEVSTHQPEQLAHHWTHAGEAEPAVGYWQKAGSRAQERSANQEAARHFEKGLGLVDGLTDSAQRKRLESALQSSLGVSIQALESWSSAEVRKAFDRAAELSGDSLSRADLFTASFGRMSHHLTRGEYGLARELAVGLTEPPQDEPVHQALAHFGLGFVESSMGRPSAARDNFDRAARCLEGTKPGQPAGLESIGSDLRVGVDCQRAVIHWYCGEIDQALVSSEKVVEYARTLSHSLSLCIALGGLCTIHYLRGERAEVQRIAQEFLEASQRGGQILTPQATILLGWSQVPTSEDGDLANHDAMTREALERIREGLAARAESEDRLHESLFLSIAAEANLLGGRRAHAIELLEKAFAFVEETGERLWIGELHRLRSMMGLEPT